MAPIHIAQSLPRKDALQALAGAFRKAGESLSKDVRPGDTLATIAAQLNKSDAFGTTPTQVIAHSIQNGFHTVEIPPDRLGTGLCAALGGSMRSSGIPGLPKALDGHAYDILFKRDYRALEKELAKLGFKNLRPLPGGGGYFGVVIQTADGSKVLRMEPVLLSDTYSPRLNLPEMLQAERGNVIRGIKYEVLPKVDTQGITPADMEQMETTLAEKGYMFSDPGTDNLGRLPNGKIVVMDPDAIQTIPNQA